MSVKLTPAGADFMHAILPDHFRIISSLMSALSETERKTLTRLLNKIGERTSAERSSSESTLG